MMNDNTLKLESRYAVIELPANTVGVEIEATIIQDDELKKVSKKLGFKEVNYAFREAEEGYIAADDTLELTEKGKHYFDELCKLAQPDD